MQQINFTSDNLLINFLINPKKRIYRHILLLFLVAVIAFNGTIIAFVGHLDIVFRIMIIESVVLTFFYLALVYLNNYVLIPRLLFKNKPLPYILSILLLLLLLNLIMILAEYFVMQEYLPQPPSKYSFFDKDRIAILEITGNIFLTFICLLGSSFPVLIRHLIAVGKRMHDVEQFSIQSELEGLKSRIYPQFLSNTLNNAGNLAQKSPELTSGILMKLSKLLRYQLYDSTRNKVLLDADIAFLENFLNLEKAQQVNFSYDISKKGTVNLLIPPLLFVPFVEYYINQIAENETQSFIQLLFEVKQNTLHFTCIYTGSTSLINKNEKSGLENVKRRLNLLYNKSYLLEITAGETINEVNLQVALN